MRAALGGGVEVKELICGGMCAECFTSPHFSFFSSQLTLSRLRQDDVTLTSTHHPSAAEMPGTLPRFPTMPALLSSLPRGIDAPSLPRGITMPSLPSLPSMPRGVTIPSLPRGMSLPGAVAMSTVSQAPRRLLQDCCSVLDHQTPGGTTDTETRLC